MTTDSEAGARPRRAGGVFTSGDGYYELATGAHVTDDRQLVVVFSPNAHQPILNRIRFRGRTVHALDYQNQHFLNAPHALLGPLAEMATDVDRIVTIGLGRGGHGALLFGAMLAQKDRSKSVLTLVFSPQTLWSVNDDGVTSPAKRELLRAGKQDGRMGRALRRYSDLRRRVADAPNLTVHFAYGSASERDLIELEKLAGLSNVVPFPLPTASHLTLIPFVCAPGDRPEIEDMLARYRKFALIGADANEAERDEKLSALVDEFQTLAAERANVERFWGGVRDSTISKPPAPEPFLKRAMRRIIGMLGQR